MKHIPEGFKVSAEVVSGSVPAAVRRIVAVLDKLPFKELLTTQQVAAKIGVMTDHVWHHGNNPILVDYRFKLSPSRVLFGSKKTIAELKMYQLGEMMNIDDVAPSKAKLNDQIIHLRKVIADKENEIGRLHRESGERQIMAKIIKETIEVLEPLAPIPYKVPGKSQSDTKMAAVLKLSDWHVGEVIRPEETERFGEYNWAIAQERIAHIAQKVIAWTATHRLAFNIPHLFIFCEQDFISGNIHKELEVTNEFPLPVQAVKAGALLAQTIATLAPHFPEVHVCEIGGDNHSRMNPKPQAKQKATNSMGYVVYAMANESLRAHKNVEIIEQEGATFLADVLGVKFLCEHGDGMRGALGIPYYGFSRKRGREAMRRMLVRKKRDIGFDYMSCGHWHVPSIIEQITLVNGSLSGTTEFDHQQGRHADPSQVSFMVSPKHSTIFDWTAWQPAR